MNKKLVKKLESYFSKAKDLEDVRKRYRHAGSFIMKYDEFDSMDYTEKQEIIDEIATKYFNKLKKFTNK